MTNKKNEVKAVMMREYENPDVDLGDMTVNQWLFAITGTDGIARWHKPIMEVSHSTIRRALDELASEGKLTKFMLYGHCFDEWRYKVRQWK